MTCKELHCYLENPMRMDIYISRESLPKSVSEHLASCADCAQLFAEQKTLGVSLSVLRDSAPEIPASLEAAVFSNYRRELAHLDSKASERRFPTAWACAFAAVTVAVVAAILFITTKPETTQSHSPIVAQQPANTATTAEAQHRAMPAPKPVVAKTARPAKSGNSHPVATAANHNVGFPPGFARLMYCDAISCAGALEVIRVQLPAPAAASTPTSAQNNVPVMADILVGADGIARGIRIVR